MLELTCTKCRTLMTLDDAFAGGVCRCQKCGAIQTVPSQPKPAANPPRRPATAEPGNNGKWVLLLLVALLIVVALAWALLGARWH